MKRSAPSNSALGQSPAWPFFTRSQDKLKASCKLCPAIISTSGGSTKGILTHLRSRHPSVLPVNDSSKSSYSVNTECPVPAQEESSSNSSTIEVKRQKITEYFCEKTEDSAVVLARMVAKDGIPFRLFVTSHDLRSSLNARGVKVPNSQTTITKQVLDVASRLETLIKDDIQQRKRNGERFSLTLDEWTALNNRRYMNINVHMSDHKVHHLGLVRIKGSMPATSCADLVKQRVHDFGLSVKSDIIACTTDGASVMVKFAKLINVEHQQCLAHCIHLAVCDSLFNCQPEDDNDSHPDFVESTGEMSAEVEVEDELEIDESSTDTDMGDFNVDGVDENERPQIKSDVQDTLNRVRKCILLFKRSPVRNDTLQKFVQAEHGKQMALLLDTRTRWNSQLAMIQRFLLLQKPIQNALVHLDLDITFSRDDIDQLKEISAALHSLELVIATLSRRDCNLIMADTAMQFAISELRTLTCHRSSFSQRLLVNLEKRYSQRRSTANFVTQFLHRAGRTEGMSELNVVKYFLVSLTDRLGIVKDPDSRLDNDDTTGTSTTTKYVLVNFNNNNLNN